MRFSQPLNSPTDHQRARKLRNNASPYEKALWVHLRTQAKPKNLRFRRQQPIHPYIADFACMEARLLIELDGFSHDVRYAYDQTRDQKLRAMGFTILRFSNDDVKNNLAGVVETILLHAERLTETSTVDPESEPPS